MMRISTTLLCLLCSFTFLASGQIATISGTITDEKQKVLAGTVVHVKDTKLTAITDLQGKYVLHQVPDGLHELVFSSTGYLIHHHQLIISEGKSIKYSIQLSENTHELEDVVIESKTKAQEIKESGFNVNAIETRQYANSSIDINQVLNRSTGVRIREQGGLGSDFNFSLNGLSGKSIHFFLDGIPMESFGSSLTLNNIPVNIVERVDVYKGVVPVMLGADALGGAVNVVTNHKMNQFLDVSYSAGSFNTHRAALSGQYVNASSGFMVRANGFYNYSDNNYLMRNNPGSGVDIQNVENGRFVNKDSRRFHDKYRSYMGQVEAGLVKKKWADILVAGFIHSNQFKEIQTARTVNVVIGKAHNTSSYAMYSLKYKKDNFLISGLSLNAYGSFGQDKIAVTDTSTSLFWWNQVTIPKPAGGELGDRSSLYHYTTTTILSRINLQYEINKTHSFNFNYNFSNDQRKGYNELDASNYYNIFDKPAELRKNIAGISYLVNLFDAKLSASVFAKYFGYSADSQILVEGDLHDYYKKNASITMSYTGYGTALRYKLTGAIGIKASYERSYRLPEIVEIFGDGLLYLPNFYLKPEASANTNLGTYYLKKTNTYQFSFESSGFYRNATNFIRPKPVGAGGKSTTENIEGVIIKGIEGDLKFDYKRIVMFGVNGSYQHAIDNKKVVTLQGITTKNNTYGNRIPNQPWFFGNLDVGLGKNDLAGKKTRIQLNWSTQYIHWFYLSWEGFATNHASIPSQLIHNASIIYSLKEDRYNMSLECNNLTHAFAYDNFRLQKPGRSFSIKLRYSIK